jgi:beta-phosphoglucomutase
MAWFTQFDLVLFDFDGLLVNTEALHYRAYKKMLESEGFTLDWTFEEFCSIAHRSSQELKMALYRQFQKLRTDWEDLYSIKKQNYENLLISDSIELMPGVKEVLEHVIQIKVPLAVVTNSFLNQIKVIREKIPELQLIENWITREDYQRAKPSPDGYLLAIKKLGKPNGRFVGFEDSLRGVLSLKEAGILPVYVSSVDKNDLDKLPLGCLSFSSFYEVMNWKKVPENRDNLPE